MAQRESHSLGPTERSELLQALRLNDRSKSEDALRELELVASGFRVWIAQGSVVVEEPPSVQRSQLDRLSRAAAKLEKEIHTISGFVWDSLLMTQARYGREPGLGPETDPDIGEIAKQARWLADLATLTASHLKAKATKRGPWPDPVEKMYAVVAADIFDRYSEYDVAQGKTGALSYWEQFLVALFRVVGCEHKGESLARSVAADRKNNLTLLKPTPESPRNE